MHWRYPVRVHDHTKAVPPPPDAWRYINEGFYEDYTDNYNSEHAATVVLECLVHSLYMIISR